MAEESGKGIALVILGIVAIIAIVGLVLLFTGAKKATGEFAVQAPKQYGGAIEGVTTPYDRAFTGRSFTFPSGEEDPFSGLGGEQVKKGGTEATYGEQSYQKAEQYETAKSYERAREQTPGFQTTCQRLSYLSGYGDRYTEPAEASNEIPGYTYLGRDCKSVSELLSVVYRVNPDQYGLARDTVAQYKSIGEAECCEAPSLQGTI